MTEITIDDIREQAEKAAKHLHRLQTMCEGLNPDFQSSSVSPEDYADEITNSDFFDQFEPREFKVTFWVAIEHEATVMALSADDAADKFRDNPGEYHMTESGNWNEKESNILEDSTYEIIADEA